MPRFLCKNYTRLYVQEREDLFDRCLLVSPGVQFTSNSLLSLTQDQLYAPWEVEGYPFDNNNTLLGEISIGDELRRLIYAVTPVESVSEWDRSLGEEDIDLEMADGWSELSHEIFCTDSTYVDTAYIPVLDTHTEQVAPCFLEDMETCDYLCLHPERYYPSVDKLVSRSRSKPVTDPLLGENGEFLLTESLFLAEDKLLELGVRTECHCFEEVFDRETTEEDLVAGGGLSLLEAPDVSGGLEGEEVDLLDQVLQLGECTSPLSEVTEDKLMSDIRELNPVSVAELASGVEAQLDISFTEEIEGDNHAYSPQIEEPLRVLESPLVSHRSGPGLLTQLTTDHSILPLTPLSAPRHFLSPEEVERCERALRRTNQVPEEVGGMLLVEPDISRQLYYPLIEHVMSRLDMSSDEDTSSIDMELRWDPLTQYYDIIQATKEMVGRQAKLEVNSKETVGDQMFCVDMQEEDLTKYDSLLPALDRESLEIGDNAGYLQDFATVASLDRRNDCISTKPKVHFSDHNTELETKVGIPKIKTSHHSGISKVSQDSTTKTSSAFNQFDDIDSFLLLRQKRQSTNTPHTTSPPSPPRINSEPKRVCLLPSPKRSKLVIDQVPLNELYREALNLLMSYGDPLLKQVQEYGHLQESSFINLVKYPDMLQFLLREHKHQWLEQDMPMGCQVWYKLRTISQLFCLVSSGAALLATSLNAAIDVLFEIVNKYKVLVQDSLVTIGNSLVGIREKLQNSFHPKIIQTIFIIIQNENSLTKCSSVGIIVFDNECTSNLASEMIGILESQVSKLSINLIKAPSNETYNNYHEVLLKAFDNSHCLLCETSTLSYDNFPWEKVSLIILYNLNENSDTLPRIKEMTQENCKIHLLRASMETDIVQTSSRNKNVSSENIQSSRFIICSTNVSEEHGLLELIESKCNLFLVERDFRSLGLADYSPDLIVNESTCILLVYLSSLNSEARMNAIFKKLHDISVAYTVCYVLAYTESTEEYVRGDTPSVLAMLNSRISKLKMEDNHCEFKLKGSTETDGIANVISCIVGQHTTGRCEVEEVEIEAGEQEKWLLSLKCINSFGALTMLSKYPLKDLIRQELTQLKCEFPEIPQQSLALFHQICHQNYGEWSNLVDYKAQHRKPDMLIEAMHENSTQNDLANKIPTMVNDTTLSNYVRASENNCKIMITNKLTDTNRSGNAWGYEHAHSNAFPSGNDNYQFMSRTVSSHESKRGCTDKVRPIVPSGGLLAFQKQEGYPSISNPHFNKYLIDGDEQNPHNQLCSQTNNRRDQVCPADSYSSGLMDNTRGSIENSEWVGKVRESEPWRHRELSCKQVPGVTQTKLIFK